MRKNRNLRDSNWREEDDMNTTTIDTFSVVQAISGALRRKWGDMRSPVKLVARATGTDVRTARNYWDGTNAPRAPELLRLMAECPEVREAVERLIANHKGLNNDGSQGTGTPTETGLRD